MNRKNKLNCWMILSVNTAAPTSKLLHLLHPTVKFGALLLHRRKSPAVIRSRSVKQVVILATTLLFSLLSAIQPAAATESEQDHIIDQPVNGDHAIDENVDGDLTVNAPVEGSITVKGDIDGNLDIKGDVKGDIIIQGNVEGDVTSTNADGSVGGNLVIEGNVEGDVVSTNIQGNVEGDVVINGNPIEEQDSDTSKSVPAALTLNGEIVGDVMVNIGDDNNISSVSPAIETGENAGEPLSIIEPDTTAEPLEFFGEPEGPVPAAGTDGLISIGYSQDDGERFCNKAETNLTGGVKVPLGNVPDEVWDILNVDNPGDADVDFSRFRLIVTSCHNTDAGIVDSVDIQDASSQEVGAYGGLFTTDELNREISYIRGTADCDGSEECSPRYVVQVTFRNRFCISASSSVSTGFSLGVEANISLGASIPWCVNVGNVMIEQVHTSRGILEETRWENGGVTIIDSDFERFGFGPLPTPDDVVPELDPIEV